MTAWDGGPRSRKLTVPLSRSTVFNCVFDAEVVIQCVHAQAHGKDNKGSGNDRGGCSGEQCPTAMAAA